MPDTEFISTGEAAIYIGVSADRVREFIREGRLPISKRIGRAYILRLDDVLAFAATPREKHVHIRQRLPHDS